jgi:hypothetical protein
VVDFGTCAGDLPSFVKFIKPMRVPIGTGGNSHFGEGIVINTVNIFSVILLLCHQEFTKRKMNYSQVSAES